MKILRLFSLTLVVLVISACAGSPRNTSWPKPRPLGHDIPTFHAEIFKPSENIEHLKTITFDSNMITLAQALELTLQHNPELAVSAWELREKEAAGIQDRLFPNPEIEVELEDVTVIQVSQVIELGGKRAQRAGIAQLESDGAGWDYEKKRLEVLTQTKKLYIDILAAQKKFELAESTLAVAKNVDAAVADRIAAGKDSPVEQIKSRTELASANLAVELSQRSLANKYIIIAKMWGSPSPRFDRVEGKLTNVPEMLDYQYNISLNPELLGWDVEIKQAELELKAEKHKRFPDLQFLGGIITNQTDSEHTFKTGIALSIPLFDRNQGAILAARAHLERVKCEKNAAEAALQTQLAEVCEELIASHRTALIIQKEILPGAIQVFASAEEGFRMGRFRYLDMADARRILINAGNSLLEALVAYHKATADLEQLTGQEIPMENLQ
ncbi:TolC family protein [bacterium]|nr:TolC family protein [bacterium]